MLLHTHAHVCVMHTLENISSIHVVSRIGAREKFFEISGRVEIRNGSAHDPVRAAVYPFGDPRIRHGRVVFITTRCGSRGGGRARASRWMHLGWIHGRKPIRQLGKLTGEKRGRELFPPERALTPCSHSGENVSRIHECQRESRIRNGRRSNGQKTFCSLR